MEREVVKNNNIHHRRESLGRAINETTNSPATASADFVLQWGNRKRLRCMKIQVKDDSPGDGKSIGDAKTGSLRVDRRIVRANKDLYSTTTSTNNFNFRRLPSSSPPPPAPLPPAHRILRNSEIPSSMKGQINGVKNSSFSPERGEEKKSNNNNFVNGGSVSSETAQDSKKGGSSSGSEAIPVWPPKFVIALTNKEKEEDFMAIKGSKLPQRPKKRAKIIQRTVNLVSPGSWLCDLTLERYEVREKKISKKRPRGLKAMGNIDSDSE